MPTNPPPNTQVALGHLALFIYLFFYFTLFIYFMIVFNQLLCERRTCKFYASIWFLFILLYYCFYDFLRCHQ